MAANSRRLYVVLHQSWSYDDQWYSGDDRPIKAFTLRQQAEEYRVRCEAAEELRDNWGNQTDTRYKIVEMTLDDPPRRDYPRPDYSRFDIDESAFSEPPPDSDEGGPSIYDEIPF